MRGRHQQGHQGRRDGDVDGVVGVIAALLHLRDHGAADGRDISDGAAGHPAEQGRADDRDLSQTAAHMADHGGGEGDHPVGQSALHHQFAGEDEQGNGQQGHGGDVGPHLLEDHDGWQGQIEDRGQRRGQQGEGDRHADGQKDGQKAEEDDVFHAQSSAFPAASGAR